MLGFLFGTACLFGMAKTARGCGSRWGGGCGWRGRWGHHGHGHGGRSARGMLRFLFERLETSPGQEKVILEAVEEVKTAAQKMEGTFDRVRRAAGRSIEGEHFDANVLRELFTEKDEHLKEIREAVVTGLGKIHEALDERQRRGLADILAEGFGWQRGGGGCGWRGRWHGHGAWHDQGTAC
jgi:Spy/CpxP family protein refolding chaperone